MDYYHLETSVCIWFIEPGDQTEWFLKRNGALPESPRIPVGRFRSAEEAAAAVADGRTGEGDWDDIPTPVRATAQTLSSWKLFKA